MKRYLALGDSYTVGEGVPREHSWPVQLSARLAAHGHTLDTLTIVARTGWSAVELLAAAQGEAAGAGFDLVSLQIGVNDQYRGARVEDYRQVFRSLLEHAIGRAGGDAMHVLVLSIPDWGVTPHAAGHDRGAIADEIDRFNLASYEEVTLAGVSWVDVTSASRQAGTDPALVVTDGLHLSGGMYGRWADLALPSALRALDSGTG